MRFFGNNLNDKSYICLSTLLLAVSEKKETKNDGNIQVRRHTDWYVEYCARRDKQKEKIGQVSILKKNAILDGCSTVDSSTGF